MLPSLNFSRWNLNLKDLIPEVGGQVLDIGSGDILPQEVKKPTDGSMQLPGLTFEIDDDPAAVEIINTHSFDDGLLVSRHRQIAAVKSEQIVPRRRWIAAATVAENAGCSVTVTATTGRPISVTASDTETEVGVDVGAIGVEPLHDVPAPVTELVVAHPLAVDEAVRHADGGYVTGSQLIAVEVGMGRYQHLAGEGVLEVE